MRLFQYFILPAYRPRNAIHSLISDEKRIASSSLVFLFLGVIYTLSVQLAYTKGLGANVVPFLKIPASEYYYWQRFYQIPFFFITSILTAGVFRLLSNLFQGTGAFEDHYCIYCVAQTFPMFLTMWVPETIYFLFFEQATIMPAWFDVSRQVLGIIWPLAIMALGISIIERIKWYFSVLISILGAIPAVSLMIVFIR